MKSCKHSFYFILIFVQIYLVLGCENKFDSSLNNSNGSNSQTPTVGIGGQIDPTFNSPLINEVGLEVLTAYNRVFALQTDGKMIVSGTIRKNNEYVAHLIRLNVNGSMDSSFGNAGYVSLKFPNSNSSCFYGVLYLPDGKIMAFGDAFITSESSYIGHGAIARFNSNGSLDTTFNSVGYKLLGESGAAASPILQRDGKMLFVTVSTSNIYRMNPDSTLDSSFGTNGVVYELVQGFNGSGTLYLMDDDKILVGGVNVEDPQDAYLGVMRLLPNGSIDTSFANHGHSSGAFTNLEKGSQGSEFYKMALQSDGKIVISGRHYMTKDQSILIRLNTDGTPDTTFGTYGYLIEDMSYQGGVAIQKDGKIITTLANHLHRFTTDGKVDTSFGVNGYIDGFYASDIKILEDGKIVTSGLTSSLASRVNP